MTFMQLVNNAKLKNAMLRMLSVGQVDLGALAHFCHSPQKQSEMMVLSARHLNR